MILLAEIGISIGYYFHSMRQIDDPKLSIVDLNGYDFLQFQDENP